MDDQLDVGDRRRVEHYKERRPALTAVKHADLANGVERTQCSPDGGNEASPLAGSFVAHAQTDTTMQRSLVSCDLLG